MTLAATEAWVSEPLRAFVEESGVQFAVVMRANGQVVGQHGFTRAVDVMSACSLGAAIHASAGEMGRLVNGAPFADLYHAGGDRQIFLGRSDTPRGPLLLLAIFDEGSSIGLVQLFFDTFRQSLARAMEKTPPAPSPAFRRPEDFERALTQSLDALFPGRPSAE
jgi:hypothetical protein